MNRSRNNIYFSVRVCLWGLLYIISWPLQNRMKTRFCYYNGLTSFLFRCTRWDLWGGITVVWEGRKNIMFSVCAHREEGHTTKRAVANITTTTWSLRVRWISECNAGAQRGFTSPSNAARCVLLFTMSRACTFPSPYLIIFWRVWRI